MATSSASSAAPLIQMPRLQTALPHNHTRHVPFHTHPTPELVYVVQGHIGIQVGEWSGEGRAGDLFVLPSQQAHNQQNLSRGGAGPWHTLCVLFAGGEHLLDDAPRVLALKRDPLVRRWTEDLCELSAGRRGVEDPVQDGLLYALLRRLQETEDRRKADQTLHPRLADAVRYLQAHVDEDLDAATLADAAHVSYSHLSTLFRERFACGPLKYHQRLRLEKARRRLLNPYATVDEVAQACGFADANYFVRLFRREVGQPPGRWRKGALAAWAKD